MSDYVKTADYAAKDALAAGSPAKVIRGTELGADFDAIAVAIATKYDVADLGVTLQQYNADTVFFASGTRLLFNQTAAPTGWTKITTHNDAALRVVSGTVSSGGTDEFTTLFGTSKSTNSYTLTSADIPSHTHTASVSDPGHSHSVGQTNGPSGSGVLYAYQSLGTNFSSGTSYTGISVTNSNTGGGGGHSHVLSNMNLKYVDCIICEKA